MSLPQKNDHDDLLKDGILSTTTSFQSALTSVVGFLLSALVTFVLGLSLVVGFVVLVHKLKG